MAVQEFVELEHCKQQAVVNAGTGLSVSFGNLVLQRDAGYDGRGLSRQLKQEHAAAFWCCLCLRAATAEHGGDAATYEGHWCCTASAVLLFTESCCRRVMDKRSRAA